jgi:hypothetical protein
MSVIVVLPMTASATTITVVTRDEATAWLDSQIGQVVSNPLGGYKGECASLGAQYYVVLTGGIVKTSDGRTGNGFEFADDNHSVNLGWSRGKITAVTSLEPGDIIVEGHPDGISGNHVAIFYCGTPQDATLVQQNSIGRKYVTKDGMCNVVGKTYVRPVWKNASSQSTGNSDELTEVTAQFIGKKIALKSIENGKYMSSWQNEKSAPLYARVDKALEWEIFETVGTSDGWIGFKGVNGKFVSARGENKNVPLTTEADKLQKWECFKIYKKGGDFYIKSQANGQWVTVCIDIENAPLRARADDASTWERFKIEIFADDSDIANGLCVIKNAANMSQVLNVYTGAAPKNYDEVTLCPPVNGDVAQIWTLEKSGDAYIIHSGSNRIVLNVYADTAHNGDNVNVLKYFDGDGSQLWIIESVGNGKYIIRSKSNRDVVLTVSGSYKNLPNVKVETYNGADNQLWYIDKY